MAVESNAVSRARLLSVLRIQYPDVLAEHGYHLLHPETGEPFDGDHRHLVATCRAVANFATGVAVDGPEWCRDAANHGLAFLREAHRADDGGYHLIVDGTGEPVDRTRSAYAHAFVILAYARSTAAGIDGAAADLHATHDLIEDRFRDSAGLYKSDCGPDWAELEAYRGQNANMHACEGFLAAYEATGQRRYLDRARHVATTLTVDLAVETSGLLWEHYDADWTHDFSYNENAPRHQFRPPGYQPGHHLEWAKLLAIIDRHDGDVMDGHGVAETAEGPGVAERGESPGVAERGESPGVAETAEGPGVAETAEGPLESLYSRAVELFDAAIELGWTGDGFRYTVEADGTAIVADRYGWALAEAIGAAAALAERAESHGQTDAADRFGQWERTFLDCVDLYRGPAGPWYEKRIPAADGDKPVAPEPPGVEPDYHPVSAFYESWRSSEL